ncbi:MAG: kynureninase [Bdellovibrionales bacterium]|nr:kynureninase [Bdellovibrionales bacterium]
MEWSIDTAKNLDRDDVLSSYRSRFHYPKNSEGREKLYFTGNSLGLCPKTAREYIYKELDQWESLGSKGHVQASIPWIEYHHSVKASLARLLGAKKSEVIAMNSLTTNLHLMMTSFYRPNVDRHKIIILKDAFPSDRYAVASQIQNHGFDPKTSLVEIASNPDQPTISEQKIRQTIAQHGSSTSLILMEGVSYLSGQFFDIEEISKVAKEYGCMFGVDLAHAVGNVPLQLHDWNIDFAVWCNYKYLNGGPGTVGGCFVHQKYETQFDLPRLSGWWGHDEKRRFLMEKDFSPMKGIDGWCLSNAPILLVAALRASLAIFDEVDLGQLREKSVRLTRFLEEGLIGHCKKSIKILTPNDSNRRGAQLSLCFPDEGKEMFDSLQQHDVVCDWREPNVIRVAPTPLYTRYEDVFRFVEILNKIS